MLEKKKRQQHTDIPICIKKKLSSQQMRTLQLSTEKSTAEFKKQRESKSEDVIGAPFKDFKTTISLLIKGECIYHFTGSYVKPQSVLFMYFQIWPQNNI